MKSIRSYLLVDVTGTTDNIGKYNVSHHLGNTCQVALDAERVTCDVVRDGEIPHTENHDVIGVSPKRL